MDSKIEKIEVLILIYLKKRFILKIVLKKTIKHKKINKIKNSLWEIVV